MSNPFAVLLIPSDSKDACVKTLLDPGRCGARPPTAWEREEFEMQGPGNSEDVDVSIGLRWRSGTPFLLYYRLDPCVCENSWPERKSAGLFCGRCRKLRKEPKHGRRGLVLAWNGKPVPEGMDQAARCWGHGGEGATMERVLQLAKAVESCGWATIVLLDDDRKEIDE